MKCNRIDCASGKAPVWCPVLVLTPGHGEPARARMSLRLCDDCRDAASLADLLGDAGWAMILSRWPRHLAQPVRERTALDFDFVEVGEDPMAPWAGLKSTA